MFLCNFFKSFFEVWEGGGGLEQYKTQETSLMIERDDTAQRVTDKEHFIPLESDENSKELHD